MHNQRSGRLAIALAVGLLSVAVTASVAAQPTDQAASEGESEGATFGQPGEGGNDEVSEVLTPPKSPLAPPPGATQASKDGNVWFDLDRKVVFVDGRVVLREGPSLEMFACPEDSKEHESIVAVAAQPLFIHAALLRIGAEPGHPVKVEPKYEPATGMKIDVLVEWFDIDGKRHKASAQSWVRHVPTGKQLDHPWVFAGSGFWKDERTGKQHYHGDSGDFICVANFPTATLDLPIASTQANASLLYEAFTERIPPVGTPVRLVMRPRLHEATKAKETTPE